MRRGKGVALLSDHGDLEAQNPPSTALHCTASLSPVGDVYRRLRVAARRRRRRRPARKLDTPALLLLFRRCCCCCYGGGGGGGRRRRGGSSAARSLRRCIADRRQRSCSSSLRLGSYCPLLSHRARNHCAANLLLNGLRPLSSNEEAGGPSDLMMIDRCEVQPKGTKYRPVCVSTMRPVCKMLMLETSGTQ